MKEENMRIEDVLKLLLKENEHEDWNIPSDPVNQIPDDAEFIADLNLDSLDVVEIQIDVCEHYDIHSAELDDELEKATTISEMANVLRKYLGY